MTLQFADMQLASQTLQRTSTGVDIFFSLMRSYFCFLLAAYTSQQTQL